MENSTTDQLTTDLFLPTMLALQYDCKTSGLCSSKLHSNFQ